MIENSMRGKNYSKAIGRSVEKVLRVYGIQVAGQAETLAPRDSGRLAGSITYQTPERGSRPESPATAKDTIGKPQADDECHVGTNVEYAIYQEYGTARHVTGQPFLRPALDIVKGFATAEAGKEIEKEFKEENATRNVAI